MVEAKELQLFFEVDPAKEILDVSEDIRAEILLEFPMNLLCSDECRGLCPECGQNLNEKSCSCRTQKKGDLRWDALDNLKL